MGCVPAATCRAALDEATRIWGSRARASDGICGDASHQKRKSDHNAGNAFDLTHDPAHGVDAHKLADWLRLEVLAGRERRTKYLISNRRIFNASISRDWRRYTGSNPHTKHMHVSIQSWARDDTRSWWLKSPRHEGPQPEVDDMFTEEDRRFLRAALEEAKEAVSVVHQIKNLKPDSQLAQTLGQLLVGSVDYAKLARAVCDEQARRLGD